MTWLHCVCLFQVKVAFTEDKQLTLEWERVRSFDKDVANVFLNIVKEHKRARLVNFSWFPHQDSFIT